MRMVTRQVCITNSVVAAAVLTHEEAAMPKNTLDCSHPKIATPLFLPVFGPYTKDNWVKQDGRLIAISLTAANWAIGSWPSVTVLYL